MDKAKRKEKATFLSSFQNEKLKQYCNYLLVGGAVGVIVLLLRELIGFILPDTRFWYILGVVLIYGTGVVLSYCLQKKNTFKRSVSRNSSHQFGIFCLIAILMGALTAILAYQFRYKLALDELVGIWAPGLALALAALCTSILNFYLNACLVFKSDK